MAYSSWVGCRELCTGMVTFSLPPETFRAGLVLVLQSTHCRTSGHPDGNPERTRGNSGHSFTCCACRPRRPHPRVRSASQAGPTLSACCRASSCTPTLNAEHGCREQCTGKVTLSHLPETVRADHVFLRKELIAELLPILEEATPGICGRLALLAWFSFSRGASRSVERNM